MQSQDVASIENRRSLFVDLNVGEEDSKKWRIYYAFRYTIGLPEMRTIKVFE